MTNATSIANDAITLEVLWSKLEAVMEEASTVIARTSISPTIAEAKDFGAALLDADGRLLLGGGPNNMHFGAASHAVTHTIALHGDTIASGDVFLSNDPHNGGGLHAQDVLVQRPIYVGDRRIAWVVLSGHLMDVGGMALGSWAPTATECYQEALRFPPVRLFRKDEEASDIWAVFRNNVRLADLVELDLRGLVAGCHAAQSKVLAVVEWLGAEQFVEGCDALLGLTEKVLRSRIRELADGTYEMVGWLDWEDETFRVPCKLTVSDDTLIFDYAGAAPQCPHFINSKQYIIESQVVADLQNLMGRDLPFNAGMFAPIEVRCPAGSITDSAPPAPVASAHLEVAFTAQAMAVGAVQLAIAASPKSEFRDWLYSVSGQSSMALQTWSAIGLDGMPDGWMLIDGAQAGASAANCRDGNDYSAGSLGHGRTAVELVDIEVLESWYPIEITRRAPRRGVFGAGRFRSGGGCEMAVKPSGTGFMSGVMLGMRERLPVSGMAGGMPGAPSELLLHSDGTTERISAHAMGVVVSEGQVFEMRAGSGGGFGDPTLRSPELVAADVELGRITVEEAKAVYGVVISHGEVEAKATVDARAEILRRRLADAQPPANLDDRVIAVPDDALPLYPGVVQVGSLAVNAETGAVLAQAPGHWTDGCALLLERTTAYNGEVVTTRHYLDPTNGRSLHVELVPGTEERSFTSLPLRWIEAAANSK